MRRRFTSVPTEILRSVVSVSETGSLSKAAKTLGLSQPAVSSQIKRLEEIVGGLVFVKSAGGSTPTDLGKLVLVQARKILEANHQILLLRGARDEHRGVRIGISDLYAKPALAALKALHLDDVSMLVDGSPDILKGVVNGFIDLALALLPPNAAIDPAIEILAATDVAMAWARARDFVISPGAPIPLLTGLGQTAHQMVVDALERRGLIYRIAFTSSEPQARIDAAIAGLGLTMLPRDHIMPPLVEARDYYLPPLPVAKLHLCRRIGGAPNHEELIAPLKAAMFGGASHSRGNKRVV